MDYRVLGNTLGLWLKYLCKGLPRRKATGAEPTRGKLEDNMAARQKRGNDMTGHEFYDHELDDFKVVDGAGKVVAEIHEGTLEAESLDVQDAIVHAVTDNKVAEDESLRNVPVKREKPEWSLDLSTRLGTDPGRPDVATSGPEVAYVNSVFGLDGEQYTAETSNAVRSYLTKEGLRKSTRVSKTLYDSL